MSGRILIVDDVATNRVILRAKLAAAYYDVIQAENGADAIAQAERGQPDLILLDVLMPDMTGYEVCRRLKADPETAHIPVIMVTSLFAASDRLEGLECGADDFLSKPINDLALFARVRNLMRAKFMLDELSLRDRTTSDLGLAAAAKQTGDAPPSRVMLVPPDQRTGRDWERSINQHSRMQCRIVTTQEDVIAASADDLPDVYVIHTKLGSYTDGLRLVSHLRSRPKTRHVGIVLVVPEADQVQAAKGLDLGASDYIFDPVDGLELTARLNSQIRRKQISDRLRSNVTDTLRLAVQDPLTGLYNRRYAEQHMEKIAERARETGKGFAVMVLDIDNFKRVNDSFGHAAGDQVLKEFARRIQENLRGVDLVSRLGGEEFLIAMPDTTEDQARSASERLRRVIGESAFCVDGVSGGLTITASVGVTLGNPDCVDIDHLIRQADTALYTSKAEGRNMVTLFNSAA